MHMYKYYLYRIGRSQCALVHTLKHTQNNVKIYLYINIEID